MLELIEMIKQGLEHCANGRACSGCAYQTDCMYTMKGLTLLLDVYAYIQRAEPVVRCKACHRWEGMKGERGWCKLLNEETGADFYCAQGKKEAE